MIKDGNLAKYALDEFDSVFYNDFNHRYSIYSLFRVRLNVQCSNGFSCRRGLFNRGDVAQLVECSTSYIGVQGLSPVRDKLFKKWFIVLHPSIYVQMNYKSAGLAIVKVSFCFQDGSGRVFSKDRSEDL